LCANWSERSVRTVATTSVGTIRAGFAALHTPPNQKSRGASQSGDILGRTRATGTSSRTR
jgi:hypothetical protein